MLTKLYHLTWNQLENEPKHIQIQTNSTHQYKILLYRNNIMLYIQYI